MPRLVSSPLLSSPVAAEEPPCSGCGEQQRAAAGSVRAPSLIHALAYCRVRPQPPSETHGAGTPPRGAFDAGPGHGEAAATSPPLPCVSVGATGRAARGQEVEEQAIIHPSVIQLAQTTMRSELGKVTLDKTFEERDTLNYNIVKSINEAAETWGLKCLRYEIRDITPPDGVKKAMEMQAAAERKKRAQILESEGAMMENANKAKGEAEAILARSQATAEGIRMVSESFKTEGSTEAASLRIAEQYIRAFSELARSTNTMLLPSDAGNPGTMIAQALQIYNHTYKQKLTLGSPSPSQRAVAAEEADLSLGMPSMSDLGAFPHQK